MNVRPFRLRGRSEVDAVSEILAEAVRGWCRAWLGAEEIDVGVELVSLAELSPQRRGDLAQWADVGSRVARDDPNDLLIMLCGTSERRKMDALLRSVVDSTEGEVLETATSLELVRRSMGDLLDSLASASRSGASIYQEPEEPLDMEALVVSNGGAGLADLSVGEYHFSLLYGEDFCVQSGRAGESDIQGEIVRRESAIGSGRVHAEVQLGGSELTVAELSGLEVGDVIRLDSSVNDPLRVELVPAGEEVAEGFLCACDGSKAIQITTE